MKKEKNIISTEHKSNGLTSFSSEVSALASKLLGKSGLIEMNILTSWKSIVGEELAQYTLPQKIDFKKDARDNGTLYLLTQSGAFALEIGHKTPIILEKINTFFGYNAVSKIKIIQSENFVLENKEIKFADIEDKKLVSKEEKNYIQEITEDIKNQYLKERLRSLGESIIKQNK